MDKRVLNAIILSLLAYFIWMRFWGPTPEPEKKEEKPTEQGQPADRPDAVSGGATGEKSDTPADTPAGGFERATPAAKARRHILENEKLRLDVDEVGATLRTVWLLEHDADDSNVDDSKKLAFVRTYEGGRSAFELSDRQADAEGDAFSRETWTTTAVDKTSITLQLPVGGSAPYTLEKTFRLEGNSNRVSVGVKLVVKEGAISRDFRISTSGGVFPPDRMQDAGMARSVVGIRGDDEIELQAVAVKDILSDHDGLWNRPIAGVRFVCDMGLYFGAYLWAEDASKITGVTLMAAEEKADSDEERDRSGPTRCWSALQFRLSGQPGQDDSIQFDYYVGPKDHKAIRADFTGEAMEAYLDVADGELTAQAFCCSFGPLEFIIHTISKVVLKALDFFNGLLGNMGLSIIFLTLCVKTILFPINRKSQTAMAIHGQKMAKLKPKLEKLKEKHGDDRQAFAQDQMKLFREQKVQLLPLGGCLPMLLQIPIFFGLFSAIRFDVDLRHASFLWCPDLSRPDNVLSWDPIAIPCCFRDIYLDGIHIFPILMTLAWFVNQKMMPRSPDPQMAQQQKMMLFMPFMFGVMLYSYAAGLSLYWLTSSLIGIFEQRVIKKLFPIEAQSRPEDDDKEEPPKPSGVKPMQPRHK